MKKELYVNGKYWGNIGKPVFKDNLGKQLCVGDIVCVFDKDGLYSANIVVDNFVYGWACSSKGGEFEGISVYKLINYTQIENLDKYILKEIDRFEIKKKVKKLTMAELEEIVGEPFEIVKEEK